jgi:hypothetical protein
VKRAQPKIWCKFAVAGLAAGATLSGAAPATASPAPVTANDPLPVSFTLDAQVLSQRIEGWLGPKTYNPLKGYPAPGFNERGHGFDLALTNPIAAGIYQAHTGAGKIIRLYCVDVNTQTQAGVKYVANKWTRASIPNLGYVARILEGYYPNTDRPAAAATDAQKAAAVQTAIWFFTNRLVIDDKSGLYPLVRDIVDRVIASGPRGEPPMPTISIAGPRKGTRGKIVGPFTVRATPKNFTIDVTGADLFRDSAGSRRLAHGARLASGSQVYLRSAVRNAIIKVKGLASILPGTQVVYAPAEASPGPDEQNAGLARAMIFTAQAMVLADTTEVAVQSSLAVPFGAPVAAPHKPKPQQHANTPGGGGGGGGGTGSETVPGGGGGGGGNTALPVTGKDQAAPVAWLAGMGVLLGGLMLLATAARLRRSREALE